MQTEESNELENYPSPFINRDVPPAALPVSPNNPPWNSGVAFLVWLASVAFILIVPNVIIIPYVISQGVVISDQAQLLEFIKNDATTILLSVAAILPTHILTLALAWIIVTRLNKFSFRETLGWRWNGFNVWNCLIIVGAFYILAVVAGYFAPEQENEIVRILKSSRAAVYVVAFLATFTAPLVEEVVYRGVLYSAFQRTIGVPATVALVTFMFALVHVPQYYPSYSTILLICLLSLVLTLIRARTKNLLPCIALHTVFNGSQSLLLILQPFIENYIETHQSQTSFFFYIFK